MRLASKAPTMLHVGAFKIIRHRYIRRTFRPQASLINGTGPGLDVATTPIEVVPFPREWLATSSCLCQPARRCCSSASAYRASPSRMIRSISTLSSVRLMRNTMDGTMTMSPSRIGKSRAAMS